MKTKADGFISYERMGKKLHHMIALGYEIEVVLEDRLGNGIMYFYHPVNTTIAIPFTEWNVADDVEITYNELGTIKKLY